MKTLIAILLPLFCFVGSKAFALESTCAVADPPGSVSYITPYHHAIWTYSDYMYTASATVPYAPWLWMYTDITGTAQIRSYYEISGAGEDIHIKTAPSPGFYTVDGDSHLGYTGIDNIFYYALMDQCGSSGNVYGPPDLTLTISQATIMTGQSTRITWATTTGPFNYALTCTYNGGKPMPVSSGSQVNGYYEWYPLPGDAGTYSVTCAGPGGSDSASVSLTVNHPTGETTDSPATADPFDPKKGRFMQHLLPGNKVFTSMQVVERFTSANDGCYIAGGTRPQVTTSSITPGTWDVYSPNNTWGPDVIGFPAQAVTAYRNQGSAPCTIQLGQAMDVVRPGGNVNYFNNTISYEILSQNTRVTRNGVSLLLGF